ncbi:hypothetical protein [Bacillus norwichensis]|uniref:Secreted protein n=1 Tax=Bacillus norwichensis TaxID=2762217 RepID=A0ABR8VN92_9BACI|nr:hypothetical protein [Bacillus norwichensis]MBD8006235.1 hypothetical protein [Bacillus norwichensis]
MISIRKQGLVAFSILLLAACSPAQENALDELLSENQKKTTESNQNIEEHPAWNDSPAEPVIGESTIEPPISK